MGKLSNQTIKLFIEEHRQNPLYQMALSANSNEPINITLAAAVVPQIRKDNSPAVKKLYLGLMLELEQLSVKDDYFQTIVLSEYMDYICSIRSSIIISSVYSNVDFDICTFLDFEPKLNASFEVLYEYFFRKASYAASNDEYFPPQVLKNYENTDNLINDKMLIKANLFKHFWETIVYQAPDNGKSIKRVGRGEWGLTLDACYSMWLFEHKKEPYLAQESDAVFDSRIDLFWERSGCLKDMKLEALQVLDDIIPDERKTKHLHKQLIGKWLNYHCFNVDTFKELVLWLHESRTRQEILDIISLAQATNFAHQVSLTKEEYEAKNKVFEKMILLVSKSENFF